MTAHHGPADTTPERLPETPVIAEFFDIEGLPDAREIPGRDLKAEVMAVSETVAYAAEYLFGQIVERGIAPDAEVITRHPVVPAPKPKYLRSLFTNPVPEVPAEAQVMETKKGWKLAESFTTSEYGMGIGSSEETKKTGRQIYLLEDGTLAICDTGFMPTDGKPLHPGKIKGQPPRPMKFVVSMAERLNLDEYPICPSFTKAMGFCDTVHNQKYTAIDRMGVFATHDRTLKSVGINLLHLAREMQIRGKILLDRTPPTT